MKANNHPLVRDLRRILDKHGLHGAILVAITKEGHPISASAGSDVRKCDAIGAVLAENEHISILQFDMDMALVESDQITMDV